MSHKSTCRPTMIGEKCTSYQVPLLFIHEMWVHCRLSLAETAVTVHFHKLAID